MALLLLTYSLGFAHDIIPHCHHALASSIVHAPHLLEHDHNAHHGHDHGDADHVSHADHLDEGLFDFIVCVLSETDHSTSNSHRTEFAPTANKLQWTGSDLNVHFMVALCEAMQPIDPEATIVRPSTETAVDYRSLHADAFPHRGPPVLS